MSATPQCPVFQASHRDLQTKTFAQFVEEHEPDFKGAGVCKIVPPRGWKPRKQGYSTVNFTIDKPIRQHATGKQGLYRTLLMEDKSLTLRQFKAMAEDPLNAPPKGADADTLERKYWKNVALNPPLYGADVPGSLYDEDVKGWNLGKLHSLLSDTMAQHGVSIPGVNSPYLYIGSWRSTFAWHTEDLDLHSVNYLHFGAGKTWYVVPPAHRARFERLMKGMLPELFRVCPEFMRHKELVVSPSLLQAHNIPVVRVLHNPGEFVVTYPGAYHCGFNQGFNCAESVNFATKTWVDIGAVAGCCECRQDTVRMDMRMFADFMSPDLREEWLAPSDSSDSGSEGSEGASDSGSEGSEAPSDAEVTSEGGSQGALDSGEGEEEESEASKGSTGAGSSPGVGSEEEGEGGPASSEAAVCCGLHTARQPGGQRPPATSRVAGQGRKRPAAATAAAGMSEPPSKRQRAPRRRRQQEVEGEQAKEQVARGAAGERRPQQGRAMAAPAAAALTRKHPQQQRRERFGGQAQRAQQAGVGGPAPSSRVRVAAIADCGGGGGGVQVRRPGGQLRRQGASSPGLLSPAGPSPGGPEARALRLRRRQQRRGDPTPRDERRRRREALLKLREQHAQQAQQEGGEGQSEQGGQHLDAGAGLNDEEASRCPEKGGAAGGSGTGVAAAADGLLQQVVGAAGTSDGGTGDGIAAGPVGVSTDGGQALGGGGTPAGEGPPSPPKGSGHRLLNAMSSMLPHLKRMH